MMGWKPLLEKEEEKESFVVRLRKKGESAGLKVEYDRERPHPIVVEVVEGSAAHGVLRAGDEIVSVNGASTESVYLSEVMRDVRGDVDVHILRPLRGSAWRWNARQFFF